jgi:diguanylate cyclase (GGDEF)-like protein
VNLRPKLRKRDARDPLTGLIGYPAFAAALERERTCTASATVFALDVDGLKEINDTYGHFAGDRVIAHVAQRLRETAGPHAPIARMGGDEFAVLASDDDVAELAHRMRVAVAAESVQVTEAARLTVTVTVGTSALAAAGSAEETLRRADTQMYERKRRAGSDAFDRVSELIVGLLEAQHDGLDAAFAAGVAEVAQASAAVVATEAGEEWWPDGKLPREPTTLRRLAERARDRDEPVEEGHWLLGVPLRGDGLPVGGFAVERDYPFTKPDRIALVRAGVALGQALLRLRESVDARRRIAELEHLAFHDENTGLANRRALLAKLEALDAVEPLTVLFVDFDGLRAVNNELSYEHGNLLLRAVATTIESTLGRGELAARLHGSGGDEFIVVCPLTDDEAARSRAAQLEQRLAPSGLRLPDDVRPLYGGASVGHAQRGEDETALAFIERAAGEMRARKRARKHVASLL